MDIDELHFVVTDLDVDIVETVPIRWQGREMDSGPVHVTLGAPGSKGVINYETGTVEVEFRAQIQFPELAEALEDIGAEPEVYAPIDTTIRSTGRVFEDHSLRLSGVGTIEQHRLFTPAETRIAIRAPSQCKPDAGCGSGEQIREALRRGEPVSWNFNPDEKRVDLTLPQALGGETHVLCLDGSYTLTIANADPTGS
jgi:hypothetical protein